MRKRLLLIPCLLTAVMLLAMSFCFAWLANRSDAEPTAGTADISAEMAFALNQNYGIPGETVAVSGGKDSLNRLTNNGSADYIFKLTYTVDYSESVYSPFITGMALSGAEALGLIAGGFDKDAQTLVYYGRHNAGEEPLNLGELHATFAIVKNAMSGTEFTVDAEVDACQATTKAVRDVLGLDLSSGKYAPLLTK